MSERLAAGDSAFERSEQWRESVRRQTISFPGLDRRSEIGHVFAIEPDGPMLSGRLELLSQRMVAGGHRQFLEESVAVSPGDLDDLTGDDDSFSAGLARFHGRESRS